MKKRKSPSSPASTPSKRPAPRTQGPRKKKVRQTPPLSPPPEEQGLSDSELPVEHQGQPFAMAAGASPLSPASSVNFLSEEEKEEEPELFVNLNLAGGRYGKVFSSRQTPSPGPVVLKAPSAPSLRGLTVPGRWLERGELAQLSPHHSGLTEAENGGRQWLCTAEVPFPRLGRTCGFVNSAGLVLCMRCSRGHQPRPWAPKFKWVGRMDLNLASSLNQDEWKRLFLEEFHADGSVQRSTERDWEGDDGFWRNKRRETDSVECLRKLRKRVHPSQHSAFDLRVKREEKEMERLLKKKHKKNL